MAKPKKSRVGRAVKKDARSPAKFESGQSNEQFDVAKIGEELNIQWLNGSGRYFRPDAKGEWLDVGEKDIRRTLKNKGVFSRASNGESCSQVDRVLEYVQEFRRVSFVGELAGYKAGIHEIGGQRFVILRSYKLIEPAKGSWPVLSRLLEGMLKTEEVDQRAYLFAWLKIALVALRSGEKRGGQALVLVGGGNAGKSFIQKYVISPILGGREADPTAYLTEKSNFNSELMKSEHWFMSELTSGLDRKSRLFLGEQLKKIVATEGHSYHKKGCDAVTVNPYVRLTISINDSPDRIKVLPPITPDIQDKVMILRVESKPMPMPTESDEERQAFRAAIQAELPHFIDFLLGWEIPEELRSSRFGVKAFHHPRIVSDLFDQEPESGLLYMIDRELFSSPESKAWGWRKSMELDQHLRRNECIFEQQAKKLLSFTGACGVFLAKLEAKFANGPDCKPKNHKSGCSCRFLSKHTGADGNFWMIRPPH